MKVTEQDDQSPFTTHTHMPYAVLREVARLLVGVLRRVPACGGDAPHSGGPSPLLYEAYRQSMLGAAEAWVAPVSAATPTMASIPVNAAGFVRTCAGPLRRRRPGRGRRPGRRARRRVLSRTWPGRTVSRRSRRGPGRRRRGARRGRHSARRLTRKTRTMSLGLDPEFAAPLAPMAGATPPAVGDVAAQRPLGAEGGARLRDGRRPGSSGADRAPGVEGALADRVGLGLAEGSAALGRAMRPLSRARQPLSGWRLCPTTAGSVSCPTTRESCPGEVPMNLCSEQTGVSRDAKRRCN